MTELNRRTVLSAIGAGASLVGSKAVAAPAITRGLPDVAVVGAGAFGAWTALCLQERGAKVTLLDAFGPGNARQTSGDETRQIRSAYGAEEIYTRWAQRAFGLWGDRQAEFGRALIFPNGVLSPNEPRPVLAAEQAIFDKLKIPYEILSQAELKARWPQARFDDVEYALFEPQAGTVKARESIIAVSEVLQKKGGAVRIGAARPVAAAGERLAEVELGGGERLSAGSFVFACGPWLPSLFPTQLDGYIALRRSEVFYVGSPAGDDRFSWRRLPNMWESRVGAYAMSDIDYGYKVVPSFGVPIDPEADDRMASAFQIRKVRAYLNRRIPALVDQPIVASRVCALENSNNHHFIIDTHPAYNNAWIAGAGSGHAFKMGPALGEYVSERVLGRADDPEAARLFSLSTHSKVT